MHGIWKLWRSTAAVCTAGLLLAGCGYRSERGEGTESTSIIETAASKSMEITQEDRTEAINRKLKDIDFSINEHPVDTERYDTQTHLIYKAAFLKAITNQKPIRNGDKAEPVYYKDLLDDAGEMDEDELLEYIKKSDFYYQDFDGDGLPELTVNTEGSCVLKYDVEEDIVELYYRKEQGWHLLGTGKMYNEYPSSSVNKGTRWDYAYEIVDCGKVKQSIVLSDIRTSDASSNGIHTYKVSVDEYKDIEVDEEQMSELAGAYHDATGLAPHPMTFSAMFGDGESGGYYPGSQPEIRYLLEEREYLPMNEETGEEWEAYKTMLRGDFSLVESEFWPSLQDRYESSLKEGNGICDWSYFLMDFNQDGRNELCIRYRSEGVNNTAFFRYEDGQVKMWGSYDSADSHGYQLPLRNGRLMSVYWYQNDKEQWIYRLDEDFNYIDERSYATGIKNEEEDDNRNSSDNSTEAKVKPYYDFQDYYRDGKYCCAPITLSEEEWTQIEEMIEDLMIPEAEWKPCSVFTPLSDRPEIPAAG